MWHSIRAISDGQRFSKESLLKFAIENAEKYHVDIVDAGSYDKVFVVTWYFESFVNDFRDNAGMYTFLYKGKNGIPCKVTVFAFNDEDAAMFVEDFKKLMKCEIIPDSLKYGRIR